MGRLQFLNQDNEWENFPTDEEITYLRANLAALEELGYSLVCQMCNTLPTKAQIQTRWIKHEWTCAVCNTVNSAGKA